MSYYRWTPEAIEAAIRVLRRHSRLSEGIEAVARELHTHVTRNSLDCALRKAHKGTAASYLASPAKTLGPDIPVYVVDDDADGEAETAPMHAPPSHAEMARMVALAKKQRGLSLEDLCNEMGIPPKRARELAEQARASGYHVDIHDGRLDFRPVEAAREVAVEAPRLNLGDEMVIAVASDMHHASKHHETDALKRHVEWCYENGAREFINPGDTVAGGYRFLRYEVTSNGIDAQCEEACRFFEWAGTDINWRMIAGNHCESFDVGIDAGAMIAQKMRANGIQNVHYYGPRAARLRMGPTRIALHHPGGGLAYALSYKIQKYIDAMPLQERPHFLFTGHTHQKLWLERGGVNGFLCGTFENGDSSFGRMLGGEVQVGGWLIRYRHDEHGNVATVAAEFRKQPHRRMNYIQVPTCVNQ